MMSRSRTALIALLGLGLLACASARRDLKQYGSYGSSSSYGSSYTGPNTIIVDGKIPAVNMGCGSCATTTTYTDCPPELTENDPVQVITPCDIQYETSTKCTSQNVPDKFQNVYGGGKLHPGDVDNINWHVDQYMGYTLQGQQGVPSSVSTNCFKKPVATTYNSYAAPVAPSYAAPKAAGCPVAPKAAAPYNGKQGKAHAKPRHLQAMPKPSGVTAPKPVAVNAPNAAPSTFVYKAPGSGASSYQTNYPQTDLYLDPVMVYGDVPKPVCFQPPSYQCSPSYTYTPTYVPPTCGNQYGDPMTGNYGTAGPYQGIVIQKPGTGTYSPTPSPNACWVAADWVQPVISKGK